MLIGDPKAVASSASAGSTAPMAPVVAKFEPVKPQFSKAAQREEPKRLPKPIERPEPVEGSDEAEDEKSAAPARTGKEAGMTALFMNVGRKQLVTAADVVGKIAGVTRLPAQIVGAIDIHQRHLHVDVADEHADLVQNKLTGIRMKGIVLKVARVEKDLA